MDVIAAIKAKYDALSRTQKRIADYVLENTDEVCFLSLKVFSQRVNATEVTVANFTHRIGLEGFLDLKNKLQSYLRHRLSPNDKLKRAFDLSDGEKVQPRDCVENDIQNLRYTFGALSDEAILQALNMLENADVIYVVGYDSTMPVAQFMVLRLRYLGLKVQMLDFLDMPHLTLEASRKEQKALFILISFPVHLPRMKALSALLHQAGQALLAIVSDSTCEVAQNATLALCCETSDVVFYNSITSAISLVNLICTLYASRHREQLLRLRDAVQGTYGQMQSYVFEHGESMELPRVQ